MLSKKYRMRRNVEFNYVFKKGVSFPSKFVIFYYAKSKNPIPKIGIVVSKKIGNAVTRNKIKRIFRQSLRKLQNQLVDNVYLVFIVRNGIDALSFNEIDSYINMVLNKNKLLKV